MLYRYDQLNRIKTAVSAQNTYQTGYSYDANGNILSLLRNDHNNNTIDNLSYSYNTTINNRLNQIRDNSGDNTGLTSSSTPFSYQYDNIGNLIEDEEGEINEITWTVYGKVQSVEKNDDTMISYKYDATGNRIYKKVNTTETHYVRDASGNLMATYENEIAKDFVIYGSSRIGVYNGSTQTGKRTLGNKKYELSNHLGNVLSVISDNKIGIDNTADFVADYYEPYIVSESDYYPYGMTMEKRSFASSEYRFGFNTQEKSTELGEDTYTAEFWQYDSKIARRWNVDPVDKFWESSYATFSSNPLIFTDELGLNADFFKNEDGHVVWRDSEDDYILDNGERYDNIGKTHTREVVDNENNLYYTHDIEEENEDGTKRIDNYVYQDIVPAGDLGLKNYPDEALGNIGTKVLPERNFFIDVFLGQREYNGYPVSSDGKVEMMTQKAVIDPMFTPMGGASSFKYIPKIKTVVQVGLRNPRNVDAIKKILLDPKKAEEIYALKESLSGYIHKGVVYLEGGHHRVAAAKEILKETGNAEPLRRLLQGGRWTKMKPHTSRPLPGRSFWAKVRNKFNF